MICEARPWALGLGDVAVRSGRYAEGEDHLQQALILVQKVGDRSSEAGLLDSLGTL